MSVLSTYRRYAPFTADRLVDAANSILAPKGAQTFTKRTLRFYTAQSVVPPPMGSPKFARYGYEHLLTLLAARALQDQGMKLEQIVHEVSEIRRGQLSRLENLVDSWLNQARMGSMTREYVSQYGTALVEGEEEASIGSSVKRVLLTPNTTLEIAANVPLRAELEAAIDAIRAVITTSNIK